MFPLCIYNPCGSPNRPRPCVLILALVVILDIVVAVAAIAVVSTTILPWHMQRAS